MSKTQYYHDQDSMDTINPEFLSIIPDYINTQIENCKAMRQEVDNNDPAKISAICHTSLGTAKTLGLNGMHILYKNIQEDAKSDNLQNILNHIELLEVYLREKQSLL